jgi:hypothetical protein
LTHAPNGNGIQPFKETTISAIVRWIFAHKNKSRGNVFFFIGSKNHDFLRKMASDWLVFF